MVAHSINELANERLDDIIRQLTESYGLPATLATNRKQALSLPAVTEFRDDYADLVRQAQGLSHQLQMAILTDLWNSSGGGRWANNHEVSIMCYGHGVPKVVATASLPINEAPSKHAFVHRDLTSSYHLEQIKAGRVLCDEHQNVPTTAVVSGSISRIFPPNEDDPNTTVDKIVRVLAERLQNGHSTANGKRARIEADVKTALQVLFQVEGEGNYFGSLYEGLQQIRHRAITAPFIARTANLEKLPQSIKALIDYETAKAASPEQRVLSFRNNSFFKLLEDVVANNIHSPHLVMNERVKGHESLSEKLAVSRHWDAVLDGYYSGKLQAHFRRLGLPEPRQQAPNPPHLDDYVSLQVLVHDDLVTADLIDFKSGTYKLTPVERTRLNQKMYRIFRQLAEVEKSGYERKESPVNREGVKIKTRTPPDNARPHFKGVNTTSRNFVFWFDQSFERFDDYALWAKKSGYTALHATIGSNIRGLESGLVEVCIKPNILNTLQKVMGERFEYKQERAGVLHFLRHIGAVSPMEWETVKLLWTPEDRPYRDTKISLMKV